jgi:hypothetical protein
LRDQSAARGILTSSNLFNTIETAVSPTAQSVVIIEPDECVSGIPATAITAALAREIVRSGETHDLLRDAIWSALVRRTGTQSRSWQRIAIWIALPGLRAIVNRLYRVWRTDLDDLRSEAVIGFLETLRQVHPDQPRLGSRLWWNTYRLARRMCQRAIYERATENIDLLAARRADVGRAAPPSARPIDPVPITLVQRDPRAVESARLGSLATRLGLRAMIDDHSSERTSEVVLSPRNRTTRPPNVASTRGNGSGEAA